jgi:hypothetical protein
VDVVLIRTARIWAATPPEWVDDDDDSTPTTAQPIAALGRMGTGMAATGTNFYDGWIMTAMVRAMATGRRPSARLSR